MFSRNFFFSRLTSILLLLVAGPLHAQWSVARLSEGRSHPQPVVSGNKALFVGGIPGEGKSSARVDIYDANTGSWSLNSLPNASQDTNPHFLAVANGGRVFLMDANHLTGEVWIYHPASNNWTNATLSEARSGVSIGVAGDYVVFAGGALAPDVFSRTVDLYNVQTNTWRVVQLSEPRTGIAIAGLGKQILLAGGFKTGDVSDQVDMLNTDTWTQSTATLTEKRGLMEAVSVGNKVLLAGGKGVDDTNSNAVDVYDGEYNAWSSSVMTLSDNAESLHSAVIGNKVYFLGGDNRGIIEVYDAAYSIWDIVPVPVQHAAGSFASIESKLFLADFMGIVEVYDCTTNVWDTLGNLSLPRNELSGVAVGDKLLFAGGYSCAGYSDVVDIYTGISGSASPAAPLPLQPPYPNPAYSRVRIPLPPDAVFLRLFDSEGCLVQSQSVENMVELELDVQGLRAGLYVIIVEGKGRVYRGKVEVK